MAFWQHWALLPSSSFSVLPSSALCALLTLPVWNLNALSHPTSKCVFKSSSKFYTLKGAFSKTRDLLGVLMTSSFGCMRQSTNKGKVLCSAWEQFSSPKGKDHKYSGLSSRRGWARFPIPLSVKMSEKFEEDPQVWYIGHCPRHFPKRTPTAQHLGKQKVYVRSCLPPYGIVSLHFWSHLMPIRQQSFSLKAVITCVGH